MDDILAGLAEQQAELDSLITPVSEAAWSKPSRCDGWSVGDVVLHLAQTNEMALASLQHRFAEVAATLYEGLPPTANVDDGAAAIVEKERGKPHADVYARWRRGVDEMMSAFAGADPHDRVDWVAGQLSVFTLATTRLAETWIHTTDVADGLGVELASPERLKHVARLAWRTLPYAFLRAGRELNGSVAFELTAPDGKGSWVFADGEADTVVRGQHATCARSPVSARMPPTPR